MQLIVLPADGIAPILKGLKRAKKTIDMVIFRFDQPKVEKALTDAVARGVIARTLIAHTNRGGGQSLRKLEARLLKGGVTVSRSADDLVRYHGKLLIIDRKQLYVLGFNYTRIDTEKSRSFGVITKNRQLVHEALRLFEADAARQTFSAAIKTLVVSPENARERLAAFIRKARKELLIYDPGLSDNAMITLLQDREKNGVDIRILGKLEGGWKGLPNEKFPGKRLHVRAIVRDGTRAFVGSQSLRKAELDSRREVGIIIKDRRIVRRIAATFESDWALTASGEKATHKLAKKKAGRK